MSQQLHTSTTTPSILAAYQNNELLYEFQTCLEALLTVGMSFQYCLGLYCYEPLYMLYVILTISDHLTT